MLGKLADHNDLMLGMAARVGVDLCEALATEQISAARYRDRVIRCTNCAQATACRSFLAATNLRRDAAPGYCVNGDFFDTLSRADRPDG
jgi:hypothetical protein